MRVENSNCVSVCHQATTRQECQIISEKKCNTVYKSVCVDQYKTEYEPYTETECTTG